MNTALGNCLLMCAMVYSYAKEIGVDIKLMNNGDDCVVMMENRDQSCFLEGLDAWFLTMGFRMTCETPVHTLEEIEFCQMRPIQYGDGCVMMVRNIPVALRKDTLCVVDVTTHKALQGWMTAVGKGGLSLTGGIPIMQNFYRSYIRLGNGVTSKVSEELKRHSGIHMMGIGMDRLFVEPTAQARLSVYLAWGITPDQQVALENYYDNYSIETTGPVGVDTHINYNTIFHVLSR